MTRRTVLAMVAIVLFAVLAVQTAEVWARAGGGGSRGSRSYSAPARPAPSSPGLPSTPSRSFNQPTPAPPQRSGLFGGLMGGLAGFALGGLLGSLLFGGLGHGFGIGLMDLLLIGGGIVLLMMVLRRRSSSSPQQPAYATAGGPSGAYRPDAEMAGARYGGGATVMEAPSVPTDLERGLGHIRQMDARFDADAFGVEARNAFLEVQGAIAARDVSRLRDRVSPEMYAVLQAQCDRLRGARQSNRLEQIQITRTDVSEAWQESGRDYVTVYIAASMLDYIVDDATGAIVEGSRNTRQNIEEFWTFVRPVGANPWQVSAIQTG
jgi:predicted lipid-binding transport protein (Tim44 family)